MSGIDDEDEKEDQKIIDRTCSLRPGFPDSWVRYGEFDRTESPTHLGPGSCPINFAQAIWPERER